MINKNLCDEIIRNLKFLGFNNDFFAGKELILKYFLKRDLIKILGKIEFKVDYANIENSEIEIDKISTSQNIKKIVFKINGNEYSVINNNDSLLILDEVSVIAIINYDLVSKYYQNVLIEDNLSEVQRIHTGTNLMFDYLVTQSTNIGKIKYPPLRMKPLASKKQDIEYFELITIEEYIGKKSLLRKIIENFFQGNVVGIQTSYKNEDIMNYLDEIYKIMEKYYFEKTKEK